MKPDLAAFRRLTPAAQLEQIRGTRAERLFQVDRAGIDEKKRTAWLSIASTAPYERWWGVETLEINPAAINDERLRAGAPLLVNHDVADHVGVIEDFAIARGKLRVLARFGRSTRAEEIWQDVLDGIRVSTSVGYIINDLVLEKQEDSINHYRVTSWTPMEGSLASVPADISVGVGRSRINPKGQHMEIDQDDPSNPGRRERAAARAAAAAGVEDSRISNLYQAGQQYRDQGGEDVAREVIAAGGGLEMFKERMLARISTPRPAPSAEPFQAPHYFGEGARHVLSSGKLRVFRGEHGERNAYAFGMFLLSQMPAREDAQRWCREHGMHMQRYVGADDPSGGYLVPQELASELIKNMDTYGVFRREARSWPMKSDSLQVPTRTGGVTAHFLTPDTAVAKSTPSFGAVNLLAKPLMAVTAVSRETMEDAAVDIADHVAFEITEAFAKLEDECGFIGDGGSAYGGMTGLKTALAAGSKHTAASGNDTTAEITATDLANLMAKLPQYAQPGAKWYMSMAFYSAICLRLMFAAGGNTPRTMEAGAMKDPHFFGFPVVLSPTLPSDTTADYSSTIMLYYGDLRRAAAFGDRQKINLLVDPYSLATKGQIQIIGWERFHNVNHGVGTASAAGPIVALVGQ